LTCRTILGRVVGVEPFLDAPALKRLSTAEHVAAEIRTILLRGEVPPGTKFPEQALAQRFGVSRNTMREALLLLRSQGLIEHQLHRGAVVAELDDAAIVDVSQARRVLEQAGVAAAVQAPIEILQPMLDALDGMAHALTTAEFLEADQRFHQAIVACLNSDRLDRFFAAIQTEQTLVNAWRGDDSKTDSIYQSHKEVADAILARDFERAHLLVTAVIDSAEKRLRQARAATFEEGEST